MSRYPIRARVEIRRRQRGYCVEGPGFYVWEEDLVEASRLARDLARGVGCELSAHLFASTTPIDSVE